jgi:polysaccharide biosynthesis/export protein
MLMFSAPGWSQEPAAPAAGGFTDPGLSPGDQILVRMFDLPEAAAGVSVRVDSDGSVHLPYAGTIQASGMSPAELARVIGTLLHDKGYVKEPNVTVDVTASISLSVSVQGQVVSPRTVPLTAPAPLSYVLAQVGGVTGLADHHLTILHRGDEMPTSVEFNTAAPSTQAMNTLVRPGDIINVSYRGMYFVGGEVNRPGIYPLGGSISVGQSSPLSGTGFLDHITLLEALAQAGGITTVAARSQLHILRTENGKRVDIHVDQVKLSKGEVADPILQANDIIYIPPSYLRQQTNNLFATAISSLYAVTTLKEANF